VVVNYRTSAERAQAIVAHIEACGGRAVAVQADVFTADGCHRLFDAASEKFGRVDICVIGPGGGWHPEPVDRLSPEGVFEDVQHELAPFVHLMPMVLPGMYERRWGRVIGLAMHPTRPSPAYAYNVGKAARIQAFLLAHEQAWRVGITLNVIAPGPVGGIASLEEAVAQCDHQAAWEARGNVSPQDIAEGVAFLCSEAGRFVTGCVLPYLFNKT
jgi:NAD(P)-dependent dehydrogenase (short-subunit alcohol dehydrogenase family)